MGTRPRIRASNSDYTLAIFPPDTTLGWRVVGRVSSAVGDKKVANGEWRRVNNELGEHVGYQALATFQTDKDLPSTPSSCSITVRQVELIAGTAFKHGKSRTLGMPEEKKICRRNPKSGRALPPEDAVELALAKMEQWLHPASRIDDGRGEPVYGDKAVRVYPKP